MDILKAIDYYCAKVDSYSVSLEYIISKSEIESTSAICVEEVHNLINGDGWVVR